MKANDTMQRTEVKYKMLMREAFHLENLLANSQRVADRLVGCFTLFCVAKGKITPLQKQQYCVGVCLLRLFLSVTLTVVEKCELSSECSKSAFNPMNQTDISNSKPKHL